MLVADTSVLFALFDSDDAHHRKAMTEARRERAFVVPSEVLVETLGLFRVRYGRQASLQVLHGLRAMRHARIGAPRQAVVDSAVESTLGASPLSYPDWIVVHTCRATGSQPWTYDDDIKRAIKA